MRALLAAGVAVLYLSSCMTGPSYLTRSVDDWQNTMYEKSPLGTALVTDVLPLVPLVKLLAMIPDYLVLNPVQFWGDVFRGEGTAFTHDQPESRRSPWFIGGSGTSATAYTPMAPMPEGVELQSSSPATPSR